ncbi:MAG: tryptophan--tRNA ligase, partial [Rhodanobacteraceae bacterium]
ESSSLYAIFRAFASSDETTAFRAELESGVGWGEAKQKLGARIEQEIAPLRERYDTLIAHPGDIEDALREGARKARAVAAPRIEMMRRTIGLGTLVAPASKSKADKKIERRARIVSFRDDDGFRFRLIGADGEELLLSRAFPDPRSAGQASRALSAPGASEALVVQDETRFAFVGDGAIPIAVSAAFPDSTSRDTARDRTRVALAALRGDN